LKKLYRSLAKAMHPDLADGEQDRQRRHEFMIRVNEAYARSDEAGLRGILVQWQHSPEVVKGDSVAAELVRAIRKIARAQARLRTIDEEMRKLKASEIYLLKSKVDEAAKSGRNMLNELAARIDRDIRMTRERLPAYERAGKGEPG